MEESDVVSLEGERMRKFAQTITSLVDGKTLKCHGKYYRYSSILVHGQKTFEMYNSEFTEVVHKGPIWVKREVEIPICPTCGKDLTKCNQNTNNRSLYKCLNCYPNTNYQCLNCNYCTYI